MSDQPKLLPVVLLEWKPMRRNTLLGFARIKLGALRMSELTVHASNGKKWVGLPARPVVQADGTVARDPRGKVKYTAILEWDSRDMADRFSASVITAIEASHPGATDEGN